MEHEIRHLVRSNSLDDQLFEAEVARMAAYHGSSVYKELLIHLVGKNLGTDMSSEYWHQALSHRDQIERASGVRIGVRPALLDILHTRTGEFINPIIIEAEYLDNIRHSSITDGLTGLYDQTYFKSFLHKSMSQQRRAADNSCALILFDVDRFKQYNDRCGHLAGDEALHQIANILRAQSRDLDIAARYGGEEFALFLPNADRGVAHAVADRIRRVVEAAVFPGQEMLDSGNLTISGGIAVFPHDASDAKALIEKADRELYQAKVRRNTISPDNSDRRREERHRVQSLVQFAVHEDDDFFCGLVYDISRTGIGFGSCRIPNPDDFLILRFNKPFWSEDFELKGRVRQIRSRDNGEVTYLGVEFDRHLDDFARFLPGGAKHA
jgi:diguanylate cyclase (GGDEF)-like protein